MKKIGLVVFLAAAVIGIVISGFVSVGSIMGDAFHITFSRGIKGSGVMQNKSVDVGEFHAIEVGGAFQVEAVAQSDRSVEISADDNILPLIRVNVDNGVLRIEADKGYNSSEPVRVRISAPDLDNVNASGAAVVTVRNIKNPSINIEASGAAKVTVAGETERLDVSSSGAAKVNASELKAVKVTADASGAGAVDVFAVESLRGDASGAGRIYYAQTSAEITQHKSGAGRIEQK